MGRQKGRCYNYIYSKLVTEEAGLRGFIAYCLYKQEKIAWIQQYVTQHGRQPTDRQLSDAFKEKAESENYLSGLSSLAAEKERELIEAIVQKLTNKQEELIGENKVLKDKILTPIKGYTDPSCRIRLCRILKDVGFSMLAVVLWFFVLQGVKWVMPEFNTYIKEQLRDYLGSEPEQ